MTIGGIPLKSRGVFFVDFRDPPYTNIGFRNTEIMDF